MVASRLLFSMALLGLASAGSPAASGQDPKPPAAGPGQVPKDEGRGGPPGRPGGHGPRGMPNMPKPGPTDLPILPALPALDDTSFFAEADVAHGKVVQATYTNHAGQEKRMHVYLPPGYEADGDVRYPVLYLNHGGGDDDSKWTSTDVRRGGHAQFILDNLIAAKKAKPMIVVMPSTRGIASPIPPKLGEDDAVTKEYLKDIIPQVEKHYRTKPGRENRALAGLSMGGFVVMNTGLSHLDTFGELYVYSSGYFPDQIQAFEENFKSVLSDPKTNEELLRVPFYMAQGETDIALTGGHRVMAIINKYNVRNFWVLSTGGHEWANWRRYLHQTAQVMFPSGRKTADRPAPRDGEAGPPAPEGFDSRREGTERGRVETVEYDSKTVGVRRKAVVYTPPGYSNKVKYPVLYLLHGIGDAEGDWTAKGKADVILDNLMADKKTVPMVVVMPNGRAAKEDRSGGDFGGQFPAFERFEDDLLKDLIPFVESHYSVEADREHRALAGCRWEAVSR